MDIIFSELRVVCACDGSRFKPHLAAFCLLNEISAHGRGGSMFRERAAPGQLLKCR